MAASWGADEGGLTPAKSPKEKERKRDGRKRKRNGKSGEGSAADHAGEGGGPSKACLILADILHLAGGLAGGRDET